MGRHEVSEISGPSGDFESANFALREFLGTLRQLQTSEEPSAVGFVLSNLAAYRGIHLTPNEESTEPEALAIFNQLIDSWIITLPKNVSAKARLSKFKIIRQTAVELFMSSFVVSLRNKAAAVNLTPFPNDEDNLALPELGRDHGLTRESSPARFSSQMAPPHGRQPIFNLPTPAQTPSLYSRAASASGLKEDPAVTRLRQYALAIKAKPDSGKSPILSQWPSAPGSDPAKYSWEMKKKAGDEDQSEDAREKRKKEEARRRRRTEQFLNQEKFGAPGPSSQPMEIIPAGSQPLIAHHGLSSQTVDDMAMTQPDRGAFGSRSVQKSRKKVKKRTAGFK